VDVVPAEPVCATCELHAGAVFRVAGMDCNEELFILERRLRPLDGMEATVADASTQRLHVKYDAAKLTTSAMVNAVGQTAMRCGWRMTSRSFPTPRSASAGVP